MTRGFSRFLPCRALAWVAAVAVVAALAGCGRRADMAVVGHTTTPDETVEILAPGGHLAVGKNDLHVRLRKSAGHQPLEVTPTLDLSQLARGSAPLRVTVPLTRVAPGEFDGKATLEAQGMWWADLTFDGAEGTQTVRVRMSVGK